MVGEFVNGAIRISIHALRGEGDYIQLYHIHYLGISIHALRGEGDTISGNNTETTTDFNPRPPRGGRLDIFVKHTRFSAISIHALRGEGDGNLRGYI